MSDPTPRRSSSRPEDERRSRFGTVLGIPVPLVLVALIASALLGIQLAGALEQSTSSGSRASAASVDSANGSGKNSAGVPVVTEATLGNEVQRLIDTGTIQPMTSFDAAQCLREQGIPDSILIMEEVAWGGEETSGWLLVHGPMDRETLRANGGVVSAIVVQPACGTADEGAARAENRLWSGDVMIGSL
ncbi:hypothetical protein ACT3SP_01775 [Brachybacterium sp. AOP43-C2-M15]|uniref:hypothetical protein n=1 Tax=Brachybacterium sp. AOP43-C2-M15 TaxID=3457661 RepID=UPI0040339D3D